MEPDADLLRELLTGPPKRYAEQELMRVACVPSEELQDAIANDEVRPRIDAPQSFSSEDVKALLLRRWSPAMLARLAPPSAVPPMNALRTVVLELPEHQWGVLSVVAAAESTRERPVRESDLVERLVHEWICGLEDLSGLEDQVPGLVDAMEWPLGSAE
jgi:hypothetical protein